MTVIEKEPLLDFINIDALYVDETYQRGVKGRASKSNINQIAENFSWSYFGALTVVSENNGERYAVIDGQHRFLGAKKNGKIKRLPCVVLEEKPAQAQAKDFVHINTKRVVMSSMAKYYAAIAAGDPDACALNEILNEIGVEIPRSPVQGGQTGPFQTVAVGSLLKMLGKYSKNQITWGLLIIPKAYGDTKGQMRAGLIKALVQLKADMPDVDDFHMAEALKSLDPMDLEQTARAYREVEGVTTTQAMTNALKNHYKKTRKGLLT